MLEKQSANKRCVAYLRFGSLIGAAWFIIHSAGGRIGNHAQKCIYFIYTRVVLFQGLCALSCARADMESDSGNIWNESWRAILLYAKDRLCAPNKLFYRCILSARTRRLIYFVIVARVALSLLTTLFFCRIIELSKANGTFVWEKD